jgi:hypothetical protein
MARLCCFSEPTYSAALQIKARAAARTFAWFVHEFVCYGVVAGANAAGVLGRGCLRSTTRMSLVNPVCLTVDARLVQRLLGLTQRGHVHVLVGDVSGWFGGRSATTVVHPGWVHWHL